jgi:hypothetical protein
MRTNLVRFSVLLASVAFGACSDSSSVALDELTEAEAQQLAGVVMGATFSSTSSVPQPTAGPEGPQAVPFTFATEINTTEACPGGGTVGIAAAIEVSGDTESEMGSVEYQMTQTHNACVVTSEDAHIFTLWGDPDMSAAFTVENDGQGVVEWAGSIQGSIDWETDSREGSCTVTMEFSGRTQAGATAAANLVGSVCGFAIEQAISIG